MIQQQKNVMNIVGMVKSSLLNAMMETMKTVMDALEIVK